MIGFQFYVIAFFFLCLINSVIGVDEKKKVSEDFEKVSGKVPLESFSLHPPYLDDTWTVHMWDFGGDTVVNLEGNIRLTSSYESRSGWLWSKSMLDSDSWEIAFEFKIQTKKAALSADGLAFWYTPSTYEVGHAMGFKTTWNGLGIVMDTYDNSNYGFIFPRISAFINDGTKIYDKDTNGKNIESAGCDENIKDREYPTIARVQYRKGHFLSLEFSTEKLDEWKSCFRLEGISLPDAGYLGFTALTGGLSETHDIVNINVRSLDSEPVKNKIFGEEFMLPNVEADTSSITSFNIWTWSLVMLVAIVLALGYRYLPNMLKKDYQRF